MSRIGKKPVTIPAGVKVSLTQRTLTVQGPKGTLKLNHRPEVKVEVDSAANEVNVALVHEDKTHRKYWGLTRSLVANMVTGVSTGYTKELEVNGVGWNAQVAGKQLKLNVGYADTRVLPIPDGLTVTVAGTKITISGADKQMVGELAARARSQRKPEPYNGKGVKYVGEVIIRKEGKAFGG